MSKAACFHSFGPDATRLTCVRAHAADDNKRCRRWLRCMRPASPVPVFICMSKSALMRRRQRHKDQRPHRRGAQSASQKEARASRRSLFFARSFRLTVRAARGHGDGHGHGEPARPRRAIANTLAADAAHRSVIIVAVAAAVYSAGARRTDTVVA